MPAGNCINYRLSGETQEEEEEKIKQVAPESYRGGGRGSSLSADRQEGRRRQLEWKERHMEKYSKLRVPRIQ